MKQIGGLMAFLGGFGIILSFLNRVPTFLFWVYSWGDTVAWIIMIAFLVVGGALYFLAPSEE